jgi:pimeloyl-ACP methyl ester carboxylesterase
MNHLVLLHGALGAGSQLDTLAQALQSRFTVHRLDFEGHGATSARGRPFRMEHFAENVIDLLDANGIAQAAMFGYSMGGYVAVHLAGAHPGRVAKVATLGTKYRWNQGIAAREAARLDPAVIRKKVPRFAEILAARHEKAGGWEAVLARTADLLQHLGDHPRLSDASLASITIPVRVIVGDRDATVSVDEGMAVVRALGAGSLTVLADTPHPIEQVDLADLVPVLLEFFL